MTRKSKTYSKGEPIFVYTLHNPKTREVRYVGVTYNTKKRLFEHFGRPRSRSHLSNWIQSILARGLRPVMKIVERIEKGKDWQRRERWWISYGKSQGWRLVNATKGGEGTPGFKHSQQSISIMRQIARDRKDQMASIAKNLWKNPKYRKKVIRAVALSGGNKGKKFPLMGAKIAAKLRGRRLPKERCLRMSQTMKKLWQNPSYRHKVVKNATKAMRTPEYRKNMSLALVGRVFSLGHRRKLSEANRRRGKNF